MSANQNTYDNSAWGRPASPGGWTAPGPLAGVRSFLDGLPRPVAIGLMVVAFAFWWPIGLATLFYMIGSGRLGKRWQRDGGPTRSGGPQSWSAWAMGGAGRGGSSGNHAFDEYRDQTISRLEEEQQEFGAFLERLRFAKDKAEFDQFMAERRGRPPATSADTEHAAA